MAGTVHTAAYKHLLSQLVSARGNAGLSQAQLAQLLGKPASFVGKYELGERRLDVIEVLVLLKVMDEDAIELLRTLQLALPDRI